MKFLHILHFTNGHRGFSSPLHVWLIFIQLHQKCQVSLFIWSSAQEILQNWQFSLWGNNLKPRPWKSEIFSLIGFLYMMPYCTITYHTMSHTMCHIFIFIITASQHSFARQQVCVLRMSRLCSALHIHMWMFVYYVCKCLSLHVNVCAMWMYVYYEELVRQK